MKGKLIFSFDATKKARFGVLPRYAKDELQMRWFDLPNCFIFHNGECLLTTRALLNLLSALSMVMQFS